MLLENDYIDKLWVDWLSKKPGKPIKVIVEWIICVPFIFFLPLYFSNFALTMVRYGALAFGSLLGHGVITCVAWINVSRVRGNLRERRLRVALLFHQSLIGSSLLFTSIAFLATTMAVMGNSHSSVLVSYVAPVVLAAYLILAMLTAFRLRSLLLKRLKKPQESPESFRLALIAQSSLVSIGVLLGTVLSRFYLSAAVMVLNVMSVFVAFITLPFALLVLYPVVLLCIVGLCRREIND